MDDSQWVARTKESLLPALSARLFELGRKVEISAETLPRVDMCVVYVTIQGSVRGVSTPVFTVYVNGLERHLALEAPLLGLRGGLKDFYSVSSILEKIVSLVDFEQ